MNSYTHMNPMWYGMLMSTSAGRPTGSRDGDCSEMIGYHGSMCYPHLNVLTDVNRKMCPSYAAAEMLWYLSGEQNIDRLKAYAPQYERFAEGGIAFGSYGWRLANDPAFHAALHDTGDILVGKSVKSQLATVITLLIEKPDTRQAILTLWNAGDLVHALAGDHADLPCTLSLQFLLRGDRLHLVATMRSNDVWLGTPYDVFCFTTLQTLIADALRVETGSYTHNVGSLHVYDRNAVQAAASLSDHKPDTHLQDCMILGYESVTNETRRVSECVKIALNLEDRARGGRTNREALIEDVRRDLGETVIADLVLACALKWKCAEPGDLTSPLLEQIAEVKYADR